MNILAILCLTLSSFVFAKELRKINLHRRALSDNSLPISQDLDIINPNSCLLHKNIAVQIDFEEQVNNTESGKIPISSDHIFLAVALWSNETGFTDPSGASFTKDFVCDIVDCTKENTTFQFNSFWLDLNTPVNRVHLNKAITASIAGGAWQLKNSALSYNFTSLNKLTAVSLYGWIGLGTGFDARHNFQTKNPMFSLLLPNNRSGTGSLMFGFDPSIADIHRPLMVINSDANWKMPMISLSFGSIVHFDADQPLPLMFDLMANGMVVPKIILDNLRHHMRRYNLTCGGGVGVCQTLLDISNLPPLVFAFSDGKNLSLSPNDYMIPRSFGLPYESYISITFRQNENMMYYEDHIILGWDILARFYTFFQQIDGVNTISFYEINSTNPYISSTETSSDLSLILLITGVILVIVVLCIGIVMFAIKKKKPSIQTETTEMSKFESSSMSEDPQEHNQFL